MTRAVEQDSRSIPSSVLLRESALTIYTDGSAFSTPRRGGIGYRFIFVDTMGTEAIFDHSPLGRRAGNSAQMELLACIDALKEALKHPSLASVERVIVRTDSMYLKSNWKRAIYEWPRSHWMLRSGTPVMNAELWQELRRLILKYANQLHKPVDVTWVKGHGKDPHNRAVDTLARRSAKGFLNRPLNVVSARRKRSREQVRRGSVISKGQEIDIRVITAEYLRVQRTNKYKYEVISDGEDHEKVDLLFSKEDLSAGHHYRIVMSDNKLRTPTISRVVAELDREGRE